MRGSPEKGLPLNSIKAVVCYETVEVDPDHIHDHVGNSRRMRRCE